MIIDQMGFKTLKEWLELCNDEKDEIITDLWEQLYVTVENADRMNRIFEEYKAEYE